MATAPESRGRTGLWLAAILAAGLALLFLRSFQPGEILFVNDTTYGQMMAAPNHLPEAFTGTWHPGAWVGLEAPAVAPTISALLATIFPPQIFLKIYAPFSLFFLGFCAWIFFCQLGFNRWVCLLGGVAAALNMHFFSIACWGLGVWNIAAGMCFLALAALCAKSIPPWAKGVLAGLAVGMNVMEGFDVGVILSLCIGAFVVWQAFTQEAPAARKVAAALGTETLVVVCALFIAAHSISTLLSTQINGMVWSTSNQNASSKEERWGLATQWSLPKVETLGVVVPGLFGYRMLDRINVPDKSSAYWGIIGRDPRVVDLKSADPEVRAQAIGQLIVAPKLRQGLESDDRPTRDKAILDLTHGSPSAMRFSGSGEYAGVLVSLLALYALANSWRGAGSPLTPGERRVVWFWGALALLSLLAAWGRYGFFYRWLYALPYADSIRNPVKFMHPFQIAWLILAAFGLEALWRRAKTGAFDQTWLLTTTAMTAFFIVGLLFFISWRPHLIEYLVREGFDPSLAAQIANHSLVAARWFIFWLVASGGAMAATTLGGRSRSWARMAWIGLGVIIILESTRADQPWINYFNFQDKYAGNSVLTFLEDRPYEHRVTGRLSPRGLGAGLAGPLGQLYYHWLQNDFPYRGIESLDYAQWPRTPQMDSDYMNQFALQGHDALHCDLWPAVRLWQLTGTRYILTATIFRNRLNEAAESPDAFRVQTFLTVVPKQGRSHIDDAGDMTVVPADNEAAYALMEFADVLPRAKLYSSWQTPANDEAALQTLLAREFDPRRTVLISSNSPGAPAAADAKTDAGEVSIVDYRPKRVRLQARALAPAILLLNDKIAPDWKAWVDQKPAPVLRCNYLMRGVYLTPGAHSVEFRYQPQTTTLWVSLSAWGVGLLTAGYLCVRNRARG